MTPGAEQATAGRVGPPPLLVAAMPGLFVALWSTGFIGAKLGLPYAEPLTFLTLRFALVLAVLLPLAWLTRAPWPPGWTAAAHIGVVGVLVHGVYLGSIFAAMERGVPVGMSALIAGLQPVLTAVAVGPLLGERVSGRQWLGLALGLGGVVLVVAERLAPAADAGWFEGFGWAALGLNVLGLLGITAGTLYQKRFCTAMDLRTGTAIQYLAALLAVGGLALAFDTGRIAWTTEFAFALGWLVVVLSLGAVMLLMALIRLGEAARTASLFYLVPPVTALMAFALFDERLGPTALLGMAVTAAGVALVVRR